MVTTIIPSILVKDLETFKQELNQLRGWAPAVHIDIADGQFVPNTTVGLSDLVAIDFPFPIELHLMVNNPARDWQIVQKLQPQRVITHLESPCPIPVGLLGDFPTGFAINPTSPDKLWQDLSRTLEFLQVMTIEPGFQGQPFINGMLERIEAIRQKFPTITLAVDGGINQQTINSVVAAGANHLVVGSVLWKSNHPEQTYQELVGLLDN